MRLRVMDEAGRTWNSLQSASDHGQMNDVDSDIAGRLRKQIAIEIRETAKAGGALRIHDEQQAHLAPIAVELCFERLGLRIQRLSGNLLLPGSRRHKPATPERHQCCGRKQ